MRTRQEERNKQLDALFKMLFFETWRGENNDNYHKDIEFQISPYCNLKCIYCYYNRYGKGLYPEDARNYDTIIRNTKLVLDWIEEHNYKIDVWNLFSGELLAQEIGFHVLDLMYQKLKNTNKNILPNTITIPTNLTFILDEETTNRVINWIHKFRNLGINFHLSCSVEGKYMEQNRPFRQNIEKGKELGKFLFVPDKEEPRDDKYYDRTFRFAKTFGYGFHPMIYSKNIELWKKNFIWFNEMFKKYNMPHNAIFLLEVRNPEWSPQAIRDFYDFIKFVYRYVYENIAKCDSNVFREMLKKSQTINMLYSTIGINFYSGVPCSMQQTFFIRLGDLHIVPCHRLSYNGLEYGKFKTKGNRINGIEAINVEQAVGIYSIDHENNPFCQTCPIKNICNHSCFGANLESTGEMMTVHPNVCELNYAKVKATADILDELGLFYKVLQDSNEKVRYAYEFIKNKWGDK